jgi:hypothetical protein
VARGIDDLALRQEALRQAAQPAVGGALQGRVLAQWHPRHAKQQQEQSTQLAHGPAILPGLSRRQRLTRGLLVPALVWRWVLGGCVSIRW